MPAGPPYLRSEGLGAAVPGGCAHERVLILGALSGRIHELHGVGDDADALAFLLLRGLPLAPAEPAVDTHAAPAVRVGGDVLGLRAEDRDVEEVGALAPLSVGFLLSRVVRDAQVADGRSGRDRAQLRVL